MGADFLHDFNRHGIITDPQHDLGDLSVICNHCGALHWIDERMSVSSLTAPRFSDCCCQGDVALPPRQPAPPELYNLVFGTDVLSKDFQKKQRKYGTVFQMASTQANIAEPPPGAGLHSLAVNGVIHHRMGPLDPEGGAAPAFAQLYVCDDQLALETRQNLRVAGGNSPLRPDTLSSLQHMLHRDNHYAQHFRAAFSTATAATPEIRLVISVDGSVDRRTHNAPTASEVAVVVPDRDDDDPHRRRRIIVRVRGGSRALWEIDELNAAYEPLHFVLLCPRGEPGWHAAMEKVNLREGRGNSQVTTLMYAQYRLAIRPGWEILHHMDRLFHEWMCDIWVNIDTQRLGYIRRNQEDIRRKSHRGLCDAINQGK